MFLKNYLRKTLKQTQFLITKQICNWKMYNFIMKKKILNNLLISIFVGGPLTFAVSCETKIVDNHKNTNEVDKGTTNMNNKTPNINVKKITTAEVFQFIDSNEVNKLEEYLKNGGNVELKNNKQQSLLLAATYNNNLAIAKLLIKYNANVNTLDSISDSPFLLAAARGYHELVTLYLKHNPRFDIFNRYDGTGLIPAAEKTHIETVRILANTPNYPIDHINRLGWTALLEAIILAPKGPRQTETVRILVESGVNINIADKEGKTPLQHAREKGLTEIIRLLQRS